MGRVSKLSARFSTVLIVPSNIADKFPDAEVIGTDLSPMPAGMQPDNFRFEIDDACSPWVYPEDHFDFIHIRGLLGSVADWPELYGQALTHLAPGGYIEHVEYSVQIWSADGPLPPESPFASWADRAIHAGEQNGKSWEVAEQMAGWIREAGFVDVIEKRFKWPMGPWSSDDRLKDIGRWNLLNWEEGGKYRLCGCTTYAS